MSQIMTTGIGSWPGSHVREALRAIRDELTQTPEGVIGLPYLPELPARGPGADIIGRGAHLLIDLPVDLQPQGWRLVDHPGRDAERAGSLWGEDLDELAEAFDGYVGRLKIQVAGPWTLAAALWLPLGDRVLADSGAVRDLTDSLAEGVAEHVRTVQRLLPGAELVVQVDEPSLPTVLAGRVRTDSGLSLLPAPDGAQAQAMLGQVLQQARAAGAVSAAVHCCAGGVPVRLLQGAGADALALDMTLPRQDEHWEEIAEAVEAGVELWAGLAEQGSTERALDPLLSGWRKVGLEQSRLQQVAITPRCGLAGMAPDQSLATTRDAVTLAARLAEIVAD